MTRFTALLDACSLVPVTLADTLLRLADAGLFRPLWSDEILDEMTRAVVHMHPHLADRVQHRVQTMRSHFEDALVTEWEDLLGSITLPDPNDRHVVAAAAVGRADVIVTFNIRDFPEQQLSPLKLEAQSPDCFLLNQLDLSPSVVMGALRKQAQATKKPHITLCTLLDRLRKANVPQFAEAASRQLWRTWSPREDPCNIP